MSARFTPERRPSSPYRAYLEESHSPIVCLVFTAPLFLAYHGGILLFQRSHPSAAWRYSNGADKLLAEGLSLLGVSGPLVSLFLVVVVFLFMQQSGHNPWRLRLGTLGLMFLESLLLALPPFLLSKLVRYALSNNLLAAGAGPELPLPVNLVLAFGAGVYEEFLFRVLLLGFLFLIFRRLFSLEGTKLYLAAVLTQALLFALLHHLPGTPEALTWTSWRTMAFLQVFAFRTLAGIYFAYLYQERGFGIAAGSHAAYDVIAIALNAFR